MVKTEWFSEDPPGQRKLLLLLLCLFRFSASTEDSIAISLFPSLYYKGITCTFQRKIIAFALFSSFIIFFLTYFLKTLQTIFIQALRFDANELSDTCIDNLFW